MFDNYVYDQTNPQPLKPVANIIPTWLPIVVVIGVVLILARGK